MEDANTVEMLKITPLVKTSILKETLSRIGIANKREKTLFPSCYVYVDEGETFLVHFKQLFILTRTAGYRNMSQDDFVRRNAIAFCLKNWGLIEVDEEEIIPHDMRVFVLPHGKKIEWTIKHKFNVALLRGE